MPVILVVLLVGLLLSSDAHAGTKRSAAVRRAYLKSIGLSHTPTGCQVDHVIPLSCGGPDVVENLQLLCGPSLRAKEHAERDCRWFKEWQKECLR